MLILCRLECFQLASAAENKKKWWKHTKYCTQFDFDTFKTQP